MKRLACIAVILATGSFIHAQFPADSISQKEAEKIVGYLAADSLRGRGNYTPQLHKVAMFIADHFKANGLQSFPGYKNYYHYFGSKERHEEDSNRYYSPTNILLNVIGVLPGRSKPNEVIILSAHYDHLGVYGGDIQNGANDNASGTAALLLLADYYARNRNNERTLIFCAFAGEELGLRGSEDFVELINADSIVAVVNLEMIGLSTIGKNAIFITGAHHSDFQKILYKNLQGKIKVKPDPDLDKELFKRSDNFPFARKGIPAHTIMASTDAYNCYHESCDDTKYIDFPNMMKIIKAIPLALSTIVKGKDTPTRINPRRIY